MCENNKDQIHGGGYLLGEEGNQDHGVGVGASIVFIFDMSRWVVVDNQVGVHYAIPS